MACVKGWVSSKGGGWADGGRLNPLLGLFELAMRPKSASHIPQTCLEGLRNASLPLG